MSAAVDILLLAAAMVWSGIYIMALIKIGSITLLITSAVYAIPAIIVGMLAMINAMTPTPPIYLELLPVTK